ncbi:IMPACT family protein [Corynebacterium auriscanis]|uniref:IMPACT family protein n=1 Tax=Corynebacterium auriscanis TaxID=99807 RepID=UPI0024AE01E5|nr:YigZ family protein [Corynebacterium auriscanis]
MPTNTEDYLCPAAHSGDVAAQAEIEIKRSQFIGLAARTPTEEAARDFIAHIRSQYPDGRHHCSAYIIHQEGAQPVERSSDDGEPSGTAGKPMLEVLRGIEDITVVVVRYFGGVLLGTGGLVRAYQDGTRRALGELSLVRRRQRQLFRFQLGHADAGRVEADIRAAGFDVKDVEYGTEVTMSVASDDGDGLASRVAALTGGQVEVEHLGSVWVESPHAQ